MKHSVSSLVVLLLFAAAVIASPSIVIVREGETLYSIAADRLGNSARWKEIADENNLQPPYIIRPGMKLTIGQRESLVPAPIETAAEVVAAPVAQTNPVAETPAETIIAISKIPSAAPVFPDDTNAVALSSLAEAVALARTKNAEFRALDLSVEAAKSRLFAAQLAGRRNPEFEGEIASRDRDDASTTTDYAVGIFQQFEVGGQAARRRRVAEIEIELASARAVSRRCEILVAIEDAWVDALAARERYVLAVENEAIRHRLEEAADERYRIGVAPGMEHSLVEIELAKASAERRQNFADYRRACDELAMLVGIDRANVIGKLPDPVAIAVDTMTHDRADLRAEEITARLRQAESKLALSEGTPDLTVGGGYRREEQTTDIYYARVGIPLPLTNTGRGRAQEAERLATASNVQADATRARILRELRSTVQAFERAAERSRMLEEITVSRTRENLELIAEAYREGKVSLTTAMVYQTEALAARRLVVEARADWLEAAVRVGEARGRSILIEGAGE